MFLCYWFSFLLEHRRVALCWLCVLLPPKILAQGPSESQCFKVSDECWGRTGFTRSVQFSEQNGVWPAALRLSEHIMKQVQKGSFFGKIQLMMQIQLRHWKAGSLASYTPLSLSVVIFKIEIILFTRYGTPSSKHTCTLHSLLSQLGGRDGSFILWTKRWGFGEGT